MKSYLVTGAAGFIGAAVAKSLVDQGHHVITIDNLRTGHVENIPEGVEFIQGNCQDTESIDALKDIKLDAILHIAGQSSGEISFEDPVYDLQTNAQSTLQLLQYARRTGCRNFIYASTMSVYGDQPEQAIDESATPLPKSFYAVGKLASENYLKIFTQYDINCTALRLFNVYGPGQNMQNLKQGMVSIFLAQALANRHIHVKGDGNRFRDFVYIQDVVKAFELFIENQVDGYHCYNVCNSVKTTIFDVVGAIESHLPYEVSTKFEGGTPGDQYGIYGSNTLLEADMGWKPETSFAVGLKRMVDWAIAK